MLFTFKKLNSKHKHAYYNEGDDLYMNFIMQFLRILEPIYYKPGEIIYNELENIDIIIFFTDGNIDVGYEINREIKYKLRFTGTIQIGGFECTHNRRCQVIYKSQRSSSGYFIRRRNWAKLEEDFPYFYKNLKSSFQKFYILKISFKINTLKQLDIEKFEQRADYK